MNHLADLTPRELKMYKSLKPRNPDVKSTHPFPYTSNILKDMLKELPEEYDARSEGLVAPVQGECLLIGLVCEDIKSLYLLIFSILFGEIVYYTTLIDTNTYIKLFIYFAFSN